MCGEFAYPVHDIEADEVGTGGIRVVISSDAAGEGEGEGNYGSVVSSNEN